MLYENLKKHEEDELDPALREEWDEIVRFVRRKVEQGKKARQDKAQYWERYYQFFRGRQWSGKRIPWKAYLVINMTFATIETIVATMTDQRPKVTLLPSDESQMLYVDTIQGILDTVWRRRNMGFTIQEALRNALIFGTGFFKVFWDPELEEGKGDVNITAPPPWTILVDDGSTDFNEKTEWVIHLEWVSKAYIKRHYPTYACYVKPNDNLKHKKFDKQAPTGMTFAAGGPGISSPVFDRPEVIGNTDQFSNSGDQRNMDTDDYLLIEMWLRDDETEEVEKLVEAADPFTNVVTEEPRIVCRPKYPNGRMLVVCGDVVLEDIPSPYQTKLFPFARLLDNADVNDFWGIGEVELLEDLQRCLNKIKSQVQDHASFLGNGTWIIDTSSGVRPEEVTNKPGQMIFKKQGSEVRREPPTPLPAFMFQIPETCVGDMQYITGVGNLLAGNVPRGIRSGSGFAEAQDIAATRVRLKVKQLENSIEQVGRLTIKILQQYYTTERVMSILGSNGTVQWVQYNGQMRGDWDIVVGTGSMLPVSKRTQSQDALQLFQLGAIDQAALLKAMEFPNTDDILRRMGGPTVPVERQIPRAGIGGPPPKTDNSPSRRTGMNLQSRTVSGSPDAFTGNGE